jgi:hypothetical protein
MSQSFLLSLLQVLAVHPRPTLSPCLLLLFLLEKWTEPTCTTEQLSLLPLSLLQERRVDTRLSLPLRRLPLCLLGV